MEELITTLDSFNTYLRDASEEHRMHFEQTLSVYSDNRDLLNRDFFTLSLHNHLDDINPLIQKILNTLYMPSEMQGRYLGQSITLYELLLELNEQENNESLAYFLNQLKAMHKTNWLRIIMWSITLSACSVVPFFLYGLTAITQFLTTATVVSGAGLGYSLAMGIYTLYEYQSAEDNPYHESSFYRMFRDNFFALTNTLFVSLAWSLMLSAAASTPVVSVLFVAGEITFCVKELVSLAFIYLYDKPQIDPDASLIEQQKQVREISDFNTRKHAVWVNLASAVLLTVIIAAWCFIPGGAIVPIACMLGIGVVHLIKQYALKENEERMRKALNQEFEEIETLHALTKEPSEQLELGIGSSLDFKQDLANEATFILKEEKVQRIDSTNRIAHEGLASRVGLFNRIFKDNKEEENLSVDLINDLGNKQR